MPGELFAHIAFVGVMVQAASALLLATLFLALRRHAGHRPYLRDWSVAFVGLALAIVALFFRYFASEYRPAHRDFADALEASTRVLYVLYQSGKLAFFTCLLTGAARFAGRRVRIWRLPLGLALFGYALLSVFTRGDLDRIVLWQTPIAIAATAAAAILMLRLPAERRSLGTQITGISCLLLALLWTNYAFGFGLESTPKGAIARFLFVTRSYNSFIDVVMQSVLGIGMVVALFQDLVREEEAARSERAELHARLAETRHLESLGVVVSGVAHELNNPLTAILGYSEELVDSARFDRMGDESAAPARVIHEQAQRCRSIVRDLLAFARPRPPTRAPIVAAPLVQRVVRGFAPALRRANVEIDVEIAPDLPVLLAEASSLEQVLANLIANAIDASPPGTRIRVAASRRGGQCELVVEDHGPGVPEELARRVFEPFFTTKAPSRGTGLGLAVSHRIVTTHGGTIRVERRADGGSGSRFVVLLPPDSPPRAVAAATPIPAAADSSQALGDGPDALRVLVVDDEDSVRTLLRRRFEQHGWDVVEATGAGAVDAARAHRCDVAVVDLRTRGLSGLDLHEQLVRARPALARRTIAVVADLLSPEATNFAAATRCPVFDKPLDLERLATCVASLAGRELTRPVAGSA